jgi:transposase InsO family protein
LIIAAYYVHGFVTYFPPSCDYCFLVDDLGEKMTKETVEPGLERALFRFGIISEVLGKVAMGNTLPQGINEAVKSTHLWKNKIKPVSSRSIYRWVQLYEQKGFSGLFDRERQKTTGSTALTDELITCLEREKAKDPKASIPEILRRARVMGVIGETTKVSRVTMYRCAKRKNLPIFSRREKGKGDMRRFAKKHRMRMTLTDGKHFKAGEKRRKRVVLTFIDDAHRYAMVAVVGKSETRWLLLRGFYKLIKRFGKPVVLYLDHGTGFTAKDVVKICAELKIGLIHGAKGYAEGRGKIERFHDTLIDDLLRGLDENPEVDPAPASLELRINHYLKYDYNRRFHEGIKGIPEENFYSDKTPLEHINEEKLHTQFVIASVRKVSNDNVIKVDSVAYEMPLGHAGTIVHVYRDLLDKTVAVNHEGKRVFLSEVDVHANSKTPRGRRQSDSLENFSPPTTAAMMLFNRDHRQIIDDKGGLLPRKEK